jgi:hypothetical protein
MDADALLHPRGSLPGAVYWRRRLITLGVVVIVLALLLRSCGGDGPTALAPSPGPSTPAASHPASASATPTGSPSPSTTPPLGPCVAGALALSAKADASAYPAGRRPILTIGIANKGSVPCTRDVGQAARQILVTSGNDRIWSSDDCSPGGGSQVVTLQPGAKPTTFTVTWSRKRSRPGCPAGMQEAAPGTYRVTGRFGDLTSSGDTFTLG